MLLVAKQIRAAPRITTTILLPEIVCIAGTSMK